MTLSIAIINKSTKVTNAQALTMTHAVAMQLVNHVAPAWNRQAPAIGFYPSGITPKGAQVLSLMDAPDAPDALGYHTEAGDRPYGLVFANPVLEAGGGILQGTASCPDSVSSVLSHEVIELFVDPYINVWVDGPQIEQGSEYSYEACDPVEADGYLVTADGQKVLVSDFVLPCWFDDQSVNVHTDWMGRITAPFTMAAGGYMVVRNGPGTEQQVFAASYAEWRKALRVQKGEMSRFAKRVNATAARIK